MKAGEKIDVSFWYCGNGIGASLQGTEKLEIRVGTGRTPSEAKTRIFADTTFGGTTYRAGSGLFTAPADGNYFIGFHGYTGARSLNNQGLIDIDDLKINKISPNNVAVSAILEPKTSCSFGLEEPIAVTLTNLGSAAITNFDVILKPNPTSTTSVKDTYSGPAIAPGESVNFKFTNTIDLSKIKSTTLFARTSKDKEGEQFTKAITLVAPTKFTTNGAELVNNFEESTAPPNPKLIDYSGWEVEDANNDSVSWFYFRSPDGTLPNSPDRILAYFGNSINAQDANDYYYSKCLTLDANAKYIFEVQYKIGAPQDPGTSFELTIGTAQTPDAQDGVLLQLDGLTNTDVYEAARAEGIRVPENGTYYVAIHATGVTGSGNLYIDDFSFVRDDQSSNSIKFNNMANSIRVYPNPTKDAVNIQIGFEKAQDASIIVTDVLGNVVSKQDRKGLLNDIISVDLSNQAKGIYFVKLQNDELNIIKKVVLTK